MEDTRAGRDLIEIGVRQGSIEILRENLGDLITAKLGRPEKTWFEQMKNINDVMLLKTLYHAILYAKGRKQIKAAFDAALGNGKKK